MDSPSALHLPLAKKSNTNSAGLKEKIAPLSSTFNLMQSVPIPIQMKIYLKLVCVLKAVILMSNITNTILYVHESETIVHFCHFHLISNNPNVPFRFIRSTEQTVIIKYQASNFDITVE